MTQVRITKASAAELQFILETYRALGEAVDAGTLRIASGHVIGSPEILRELADTLNADYGDAYGFDVPHSVKLAMRALCARINRTLQA